MIHFAPLPAADTGCVLHLELRDDQRRFVNPIADMVREQKSGLRMFAIHRDAGAIGFFKINHPIADPRDYVLGNEAEMRGFLIGAQYQGCGYARAAMSTFGSFMASQYPGLISIVLTVNANNPAALRTYLGGGFVDTGTPYLGGRAGPQHVLRLSLQPQPDTLI